MKSEEVTLLESDKCQSSKHPSDLGNLPGGSNDEDRLQACTERIRIQKYLSESYHYRIKCTAAAFLAAFMWRRPLNSVISTTTVYREPGKMLDKTHTRVQG